MTSLQALFFLNSEHIRASTEKLATRLYRLPDDAARIRRAFRLLYGREASVAEVETGEEFLKRWVAQPSKESRRRGKDQPPPDVLSKWQAYLQVLVSANEFLFID